MGLKVMMISKQRAAVPLTRRQPEIFSASATRVQFNFRAHSGGTDHSRSSIYKHCNNRARFYHNITAHNSLHHHHLQHTRAQQVGWLRWRARDGHPESSSKQKPETRNHSQHTAHQTKHVPKKGSTPSDHLCVTEWRESRPFALPD